MVPPPKHLGPAITSRIKVMAGLDIAVFAACRRTAAFSPLGGNPVDLRIAVLPTMHGESGGQVAPCVRSLERRVFAGPPGFRGDHTLNRPRIINKPNGIVIVTGPTGSGSSNNAVRGPRGNPMH